MTEFWPDGIELNDTQSPTEILRQAQSDWELNSNGAMTLVLQDAKSKTGNIMIIVHAKHLPSKRTASLFSVVHRPGNPYPATIQPKDEDLPDYLKKSYYQPGFEIRSLHKKEGRTVQNYWVSDTPSEFRSKLREAFNLGIVKSEVLNLTCTVATSVAEESEESEENSTTDED